MASHVETDGWRGCFVAMEKRLSVSIYRYGVRAIMTNLSDTVNR